MWLSKLSRWISTENSLIDHIRGRINTSVEFLWCVWYWENKSYRLRRAIVHTCDVCCSHWLAALSYCWARLKMKMCKFKELQEPQEWKHSWEWHTNIMILTCFLLQEQQIKWAQKTHLFKCLIYTILLFGIFSTCILQESPQPLSSISFFSWSLVSLVLLWEEKQVSRDV